LIANIKSLRKETYHDRWKPCTFLKKLPKNSGEKMIKNIEIYTVEDDRLILSNFLDYSDYAYGMNISISTNGFSYKGETYINNLHHNLSDLVKMHDTLKGFTIFQEDFMETYIKFEMTTLGHVNVEILINEAESDNTLKVYFQTDQTILKDMIDFFKNLIEENR
jgi:hypothetical protein